MILTPLPKYLNTSKYYSQSKRYAAINYEIPDNVEEQFEIDKLNLS